MRRLSILVLAALVLLLAGALAPVSSGGRPAERARSSAPQASPGTPGINEAHIFEGEINRRGKPVGFHSRPGGRNPSGARVVRIIQGPNRDGVYVAEVEIRNRDGRWLRKTSTFYPDRFGRADVTRAIRNAWKGRTTGRAEKFRGPSGRGFTIEGYFQNGRINTAWPIFQNR